MPNQTTTTSGTRREGAIALGLSVLLVAANLSMSRAEFLRQGFWYVIAQPLLLITIPLGLYWLLKPLPHTASPQTPDDEFPSLEPPPPFPARSEASSTSSTSSHHQ
jgi:hypothetical protein